MEVHPALKSSWQSLEGQSVATVIGVCLFILYQVATGQKVEIDPQILDKLLGSASSATEIAKIYKSIFVTGDISQLGIVGSILAFVYYIWNRFITKRSDTKLTHLKYKLESEQRSVDHEELVILKNQIADIKEQNAVLLSAINKVLPEQKINVS